MKLQHTYGSTSFLFSKNQCGSVPRGRFCKNCFSSLVQKNRIDLRRQHSEDHFCIQYRFVPLLPHHINVLALSAKVFLCSISQELFSKIGPIKGKQHFTKKKKYWRQYLKMAFYREMNYVRSSATFKGRHILPCIWFAKKYFV